MLNAVTSHKVSVCCQLPANSGGIEEALERGPDLLEKYEYEDCVRACGGLACVGRR